MFSPHVDDALYWKSQGADFFFMSSDHALLLQGAERLVSALSSSGELK
jgi:2-keto-3-deoxy-L-rhamnonate aldolase RhmA